MSAAVFSPDAIGPDGCTPAERGDHLGMGRPVYCVRIGRDEEILSAVPRRLDRPERLERARAALAAAQRGRRP